MHAANVSYLNGKKYLKNAVLSTYFLFFKDFIDHRSQLINFRIYVNKSTFTPVYQNIRCLTDMLVKTVQVCSRGLGMETHLIGQWEKPIGVGQGGALAR